MPGSSWPKIMTDLSAKKSRVGLSCGGIVLAGGESRRMGRPKAWLPVGGKVVLSIVIDALARGLRMAPGQDRGVDPPLVVVGAPGQHLPPFPTHVQRAEDEVPGEGPLRGMAAGLAALEGKVEAAYVASCDVPFLKPEFVSRMVALLGGADVAVPFFDGRHQPMAAVYRLTVLPVARDVLAQGLRRPFDLFARVRTRIVERELLMEVDPELDSLRDFNTPEEYRLLASAVESAKGGGEGG